MKITNMRLNQVREPLGFTTDFMSLSWQVEDAGEAKKLQYAEVAVSTGDQVIWESGRDEKADSLDYVLPVKPEARRTYQISLKLTADNGDTAEDSMTFETGKGAEAWTAKWITPAEDKDRQPVFRKKFSVSDVKKARLYMTGLGVYEAYINGEKVGDEFLAPGYHSYDFHVQAFTYDVTSCLKEGENEIRIALGEGWFRGRIGFDSAINLYGDRFYAIAELYVNDQLALTTDETWEAAPSPAVFSNIYDGEIYDARLEDALEDDASWKPVMVMAPEKTGPLCDRYGLPIKKQESITVKEVLYTPKQETVLEFGQNLTGWVEFDLDIPAGEKIRLCGSEIMQDDCFYHENLRSAKTELIFTSAGKPAHVRPHFTFYGFQYMLVEHLDAEGNVIPGTPDEVMAGMSNVTAWHLRSDFEQIGTIETANAKVNKLFSNALWGQKDNHFDVPTDCPQRDERLGWTGDAQVFSETACYNMYMPAFYRKFLWDMRAEQSITEGSVPNVVPRIKEGMVAECGNCPWADAGVVIPWNIYQHYGSKSLLAECYPGMKAWIDFSKAREEKDEGPHMIKSGFHFADWLALDNPMPGPFGATDPLYIASGYYYQSTRRVAKCAEVLGYTEDAAYYNNLADEILQAIQDKYFDEEGNCVCKTQTGAAMAMQFGLIPERAAAGAEAAALNQRVVDNGGHLNTGFVGTPILAPALTAGGYNETAVGMLLNEEYPGWLYCVNLGATTIWERWNSVDDNHHLNPEGMNSLNHYSYGSIEAWMYGDVCGIRPKTPGFKTAVITPHPDARLGYADGCLNTAAGTYRSSWKYANGKVSYVIEVPFDAEAEVTIEGKTSVLTAGRYTFQNL